MTDFEKIYLFSETFNGWIMLFTAYISIVFAFIVAGSFGAKKMNRVLTVTAAALFTLATGFFATLNIVIGLDLNALINLINSEIASGQSELGWVGFANEGGAANTAMMTWVPPLIMLISYLGALFFFFYQQSSIKSQV